MKKTILLTLLATVLFSFTGKKKKQFVISFNGHGLLSDSLDGYFATYDVDIKKPETNGLPYAAMENLLQGIPARQKLLLLDACHSGEVDKEKDISFANRETSMEQNIVATTTARGNIVIGKSKAGLQTSFEMMQELFANLNNGNGATVLSAAGGREYALESDEWKNGVFTYSVLKALKDPATDENNNKKISVKARNLDAFTKRLKELKVAYGDWGGTPNAVTVRADGIKQIYLQDPDGYWIEINNSTDK